MALKAPEEIEKEAQAFQVLTFADILRALKEHPDWLEEIRRIILTHMWYVKGELGRLKGMEFERRVRERFYAYLGRLLRKARLIETKDLVFILEKAE